MTDAMSTTMPTRGRAVRARKVEKPRPLKLVIDPNNLRYPEIPNFRNISSPVNTPTGDYNIQNSPQNNRPIYDILQSMELIVQHVKNCNYDNVLATMITKICNQLKSRGLQLESMHKDQLDKCFIALRNASKHPKLDFTCRVRLLEVIELRAMGWQPNENLINYYKRKCQEVESGDLNGIRDSMISLSPCSTPSYTPNITPCATPTSAPNTPMFPSQPTFPVGPTTELVRSSGRYLKPTKIPNKNYFRDEIIIRNSDSGKVMGIKGRRVHMIEQLSETVISFQRANQGARDRLVQITGQNEESISRAKQLIEDTIRRNASPIRTEKPDRRSIGSNFSESSFSVSSDTSDSDRTCWDNVGYNFELSQYECTVNLGKEGLLKLQGYSLDILKKAKHILEEHFTNSSEKKIFERATVSSTAISHSRPKMALEKSSSEDFHHSPFIIRLSSVQSDSSAETPISSPRRFSYSLDSSSSFEFDPTALSTVEPALGSHWRYSQNHMVGNAQMEVSAEKSKSFEGRLNSSSHILEKAVKVEPFYPASSMTSNTSSMTISTVSSTTLYSDNSIVSVNNINCANIEDKSNNNVNSGMPSLTILAQQAVNILDSTLSNHNRKGSSSGSDTTLSEIADLSSGSDPTLAQELDKVEETSDQCQVEIVRQPLFPDSSKEAINQAECSTDLSTLSAKARRAQFAKTSETFKEKNEKSENKTEINSSDECSTALASGEPKWIVYSRDFLLDCAKSPFCRVTPRELPRLSRELPIILKSVPEIFDPVAYRQRLSTSNIIYKAREPLEHTLNTCSLNDTDEAGDVPPYNI